MNNWRKKIGISILSLMQEKEISCEELAKELNYTLRDVCRILEGNLFIPPKEIKEIALFFGKTKEELYKYIESIDNLNKKRYSNDLLNDNNTKYLKKSIIDNLSIKEQNELILYDTGVTREELKNIHGYTDEQINYVIITASYKKEFDDFCKEREKEREERRKE